MGIGCTKLHSKRLRASENKESDDLTIRRRPAACAVKKRPNQAISGLAGRLRNNEAIDGKPLFAA